MCHLTYTHTLTKVRWVYSSLQNWISIFGEQHHDKIWLTRLRESFAILISIKYRCTCCCLNQTLNFKSVGVVSKKDLIGVRTVSERTDNFITKITRFYEFTLYTMHQVKNRTFFFLLNWLLNVKRDSLKNAWWTWYKFERTDLYDFVFLLLFTYRFHSQIYISYTK